VSVTVEPIPQLRDNYAYLVRGSGPEAIVIDAAEAEVIEAALAARELRLAAVLSTHHHPDHTGGNAALAARHPGLRVIGSALDAAKIPAITERVGEGDTVTAGGLTARVRLIPCHTGGHVAYLFGDDAFTGDTLFSGGCGRFFEGTPAQMYRALYEILGALPDHTRIWCGHEYTAKNLDFAAELEPHNTALAARRAEVRALRERGAPTVPALLGAERAYNPFLRVDSPIIQAYLRRLDPGLDPTDRVVVLGALRALKDRW
jgi:hydroxyacylglutathione hydrolase